MSTPVVVIGFIFLIPSVLGMIASALILFGVVSSAGTDANRTRDEVAARMRSNDVPEPIISAVLANPNLDADSLMDQVSMAQLSWIKDSQEKLRGSTEGSGLAVLFGGGFAIALGVASFVGGIIGWLLVMKKRVLQCSVCMAVVNAS